MHTMKSMRKAVTIDDDLAAQIEATRRREGLWFTAALNHLLKLGVQVKSTPPKPKKFKTPTRKLGLKPGIDPTRLNALSGSIRWTDPLPADRSLASTVTPDPP